MAGKSKPDLYISVDIEADGPIPAEYSILSLGACVVGQQNDPERGFYRTFQPISKNYIPEALEVSGLDRDWLSEHSSPPDVGMQTFADWIYFETHAAPGGTINDGARWTEDWVRIYRPVFVGFNATFDWSFVHYYFIKYHPEHKNPFGISGLDIKAYAMGKMGLESWGDTAKRNLKKKIKWDGVHTHNALDDSREQANLFEALRAMNDPN